MRDEFKWVCYEYLNFISDYLKQLSEGSPEYKDTQSK